MCGLTGLSTESLTASQLNLLLAMYEQATVRGLHAFGAAFGELGGELIIERSHDLGEMLGRLDALRVFLRHPFVFLGHARYDTSGDWRVLENNQPLVFTDAPRSGNKVLAFNGVIRMSTKPEYELEFGKYYATDNDGHIALEMFGRSNVELRNLLGDPAVSFAGMFYSQQSRLVALRNERRPLWQAQSTNARWVCSTRDILVRAGAPESLLSTALPIPINELMLL